ncbi:lipoprotein [Streptomyces capparidis]
MLAAAAVLLAAGCAGQGQLRSAGETPEAVAPTRLWPDVTPAPPPEAGQDTPAARPSPVPGLGRTTQRGLEAMDPVAVLRADLGAGRSGSGPGGPGRPGPPGGEQRGPEAALAWDRVTADRVAHCPRRCPVRPAVRHDLTGDGSPELVVGVDLPSGRLGLRVYTLSDGRVTRILSTVEVSSVVEVSDQQLMLRAPAEARGYESVTVYGWEGPDRGMVYLGNLLLAMSADPRASQASGHSPAVTG